MTRIVQKIFILTSPKFQLLRIFLIKRYYQYSIRLCPKYERIRSIVELKHKGNAF